MTRNNLLNYKFLFQFKFVFLISTSFIGICLLGIFSPFWAFCLNNTTWLSLMFGFWAIFTFFLIEYKVKQRVNRKLKNQTKRILKLGRELAHRNAELSHQNHDFEEINQKIEARNHTLWDANLHLAQLLDEKQRLNDLIQEHLHEIETQSQDLNEKNLHLLELNHEIEASNLQLKQANEHLLVLNEEKNNILDIVSHDLKAPLNRIFGLTQILQLNPANLTAEQQDYLHKIEQTTQSGFDLITQILQVRAIEEESAEMELIDLQPITIVSELIQQYRPIAEKKSIHLQFNYLPSSSLIQADKQFLQEILENLVSNAIKFSPLGKEVKVKIQENQHNLRILVKDEGQGIRQEELPKLFQKFQKLSTRPTAGENSTGLGLAIVKILTEKMNGKVWCESEFGKGACFVVEFPKVKKAVMQVPELV